MSSASLTAAAARAWLRMYVSSAWLFASEELDHDSSWIVVAPHQSVLDLPAAALASQALGRRFAIWAHPDILNVAPFLRRTAEFLDAPTDPEGFRATINRSRELLRSPEPSALWVFPQGAFFHRYADLTVHPGVKLLLRAVPEVPVLVAGIDYSLYRAGRPHCVIELSPVTERNGDLGNRLISATRAAGVRAATELPTLAPPKIPLADLVRWVRP